MSLDKNTLLVQMRPDKAPYFSGKHFAAGALVGTFSTWFLFRATPIFNSYLKQNKRMVHVIFPVALLTGFATSWACSKISTDREYKLWGPSPRVSKLYFEFPFFLPYLERFLF